MTQWQKISLFLAGMCMLFEWNTVAAAFLIATALQQ